MSNTFTAMAYTWKTEGPKALIAPWAPGYMSTCADAFVFNFVYYYYFEFFRSIYSRTVSGRIGYRGNMVLATCAGACMQLTTLPLQNHSTRMQTQTERQSNWATAVQMYREEGLAAFYKGLLPCLLLSLNATIQDTIFEGIKDTWLKRQNISAAARAGVDLAQMKLRAVQVGLNAGQAFWLGLFSKLIASTICFPITRIKQMCQAQTKRSKLRSDGNMRTSPLSMLEMSNYVWNKDGWRGFVYGIEGQVFNASLKAALNRSVKERIQVFIFFLLFPLRFQEMRKKALALAQA
ncbi:unnamed protein product [Durusdinium trenchii]|uniref:Mitochondrial carrier protein n=2 Tax=Durusdinium trenchii TaxID=1381693 RepID=A0ABP0KFA5_9DINO